MSETNKRVVLGDEYDEDLRRDLKRALIALGAEGGQSDTAMGGSQELETFSAVVGGRTLKVEAETYIGLSIEGPTSLVDEVVAELARGRS